MTARVRGGEGLYSTSTILPFVFHSSSIVNSVVHVQYKINKSIEIKTKAFLFFFSFFFSFV